jgi:hypothetical protein
MMGNLCANVPPGLLPWHESPYAVLLLRSAERRVSDPDLRLLTRSPRCQHVKI